MHVYYTIKYDVGNCNLRKVREMSENFKCLEGGPWIHGLSSFHIKDALGRTLMP